MRAVGWVGVSGSAPSGKKMAAAVLVTLIPPACACARGGRDRDVETLDENKANPTQLTSLKRGKFYRDRVFLSRVLFFLGSATVSAATIVQRSRSLCSDTSYGFFRKLPHHCAVYSSSPFILLVWASSSSQSNSCQHPLPELLFSLITVMSGGMGRAGGGPSTLTQPKHRDGKINFTLYSSFYSNAVVIMYFLTQSCLSLATHSEHVSFNRS